VQVLQAAIRGHQAQRDVTAVASCFAKTEGVKEAADSQEEKWHGVLREEWRDTKMLHGVPVDLIAYEEGLLRLQMDLDKVDAGNVSVAARQEVRQMRRDAVRSVQQRLDAIDACRQWWRTTGAEIGCNQMQTDTVSVA